MRERLLLEWLVALTSGDYVQGRGRLKKEKGGYNCADTYCCLGVLADVSGEGRWEDRAFVYPGDYIPREGDLPKEFLDHVGMEDREQRVLINLNDGQRQTLVEIAEYIANHVEVTE
jgi:hypothetical protein